MECKATNDGKIAFKNELNGLFKVCFISINLSLFIFLSFRTLKDSRTLLFTWKDLLKKVQLTGVLDSVTQVKTINSS